MCLTCGTAFLILRTWRYRNPTVVTATHLTLLKQEPNSKCFSSCAIGDNGKVRGTLQTHMKVAAQAENTVTTFSPGTEPRQPPTCLFKAAIKCSGMPHRPNPPTKLQCVHRRQVQAVFVLVIERPTSAPVQTTGETYSVEPFLTSFTAAAAVGTIL
jgi:hypothetical protein